MRDAHDADDLYQRTAIRAWRGHASFRGDSSYLTWVMRILDREAARLGGQREMRARREIELRLTSSGEQFPANPQTDLESPDSGWLRIALADALACGAISAAEERIMAERLARPDEPWAEVAARLSMTATACAVAHSRAVPKLRVFLFTTQPALIGGHSAIAAAFAQAKRDRSAPLTELEIEAFEQVVIRRQSGYRRRGSQAALRGACAKVAARLPVP
jgi:RNA polymerase sigma factor (sigma-70 family)